MASDACTVLLAKKYEEDVDPTGWWISEKLDGVRAYYDKGNFYSRQGNKFEPPSWYTESMPKEVKRLKF